MVNAKDVAVVLSNSDARKDWYKRNAGGYLTLLQSLRGGGFDVVVSENASAAQAAQTVQSLWAAMDDTDRLLIVANGPFAQSNTDTWLLGEGAIQPNAFSIGQQGTSVAALLHLLAERPGRAVLALAPEPVRARDLGRGVEPGIGAFAVPQGVTVLSGAPSDLFGFVTDSVIQPDTGLGLAAAATRGKIEAQGFLPKGRSFAALPGDRGLGFGDAGFWNAASSIGTEEAYEAYLNRFPSGLFAPAAQEKLSALETAKAQQARAAEARLGLNKEDYRALQADLTALGYDTRGIDGVFGRGSRAALSRWQEEAGFVPSGYLTRTQLRVLQTESALIQQQRDRDLAAQREADEAYWRETGALGTKEGVEAYLKRYPEGVFAEDAKTLLDLLVAAEPKPTGPTEAQINAAKAEEAKVLKNSLARLLAEQRLAQLGFGPGAIDGRFDGNTRKAVAAFQAQRGITATGYVDSTTASRLLSGN